MGRQATIHDQVRVTVVVRLHASASLEEEIHGKHVVLLRDTNAFDAVEHSNTLDPKDFWDQAVGEWSLSKFKRQPKNKTSTADLNQGNRVWSLTKDITLKATRHSTFDAGAYCFLVAAVNNDKPYELDWCELTQEQKEAAHALGYTVDDRNGHEGESWNNDNDFEIDTRAWEGLTSDEQMHAKTLGYEETLWEAQNPAWANEIKQFTGCSANAAKWALYDSRREPDAKEAAKRLILFWGRDKILDSISPGGTCVVTCSKAFDVQFDFDMQDHCESMRQIEDAALPTEFILKVCKQVPGGFRHLFEDMAQLKPQSTGSIRGGDNSMVYKFPYTGGDRTIMDDLLVAGTDQDASGKGLWQDFQYDARGLPEATLRAKSPSPFFFNLGCTYKYSLAPWANTHPYLRSTLVLLVIVLTWPIFATSILAGSVAVAAVALLTLFPGPSGKGTLYNCFLTISSKGREKVRNPFFHEDTWGGSSNAEVNVPVQIYRLNLPHPCEPTRTHNDNMLLDFCRSVKSMVSDQSLHRLGSDSNAAVSLLEFAVEYKSRLEGADPSAIKLFELDIIQSVIKFKWDRFAKREFFYKFRSYVWMITLYLGITFGQAEIVADYPVVGLVLCLLISLLVAKFLKHELMQLIIEGSDYITQLWNIFDLFTYFMTMAVVVIIATQCERKRKEIEYDLYSESMLNWPATRVLEGVTGWLMLTKVMFYLRGFDSTGVFVITIFKILRDMKNLIMIFGFMLFAFSYMFFMLNSGSMFKWVPAEAKLGFGKYYGVTFLNVLNMGMFGDFDLSVFEEHELQSLIHVVFVMLMVFCTLVLLNLVIAQMSASYEASRVAARAAAQFERAVLIIEIERTLGARAIRRGRKKGWFPKWLHVMKPMKLDDMIDDVVEEDLKVQNDKLRDRKKQQDTRLTDAEFLRVYHQTMTKKKTRGVALEKLVSCYNIDDAIQRVMEYVHHRPKFTAPFNLRPFEDKTEVLGQDIIKTSVPLYRHIWMQWDRGDTGGDEELEGVRSAVPAAQRMHFSLGNLEKAVMKTAEKQEYLQSRMHHRGNPSIAHPCYEYWEVSIEGPQERAAGATYNVFVGLAALKLEEVEGKGERQISRGAAEELLQRMETDESKWSSRDQWRAGEGWASGHREQVVCSDENEGSMAWFGFLVTDFVLGDTFGLHLWQDEDTQQHRVMLFKNARHVSSWPPKIKAQEKSAPHPEPAPVDAAVATHEKERPRPIEPAERAAGCCMSKAKHAAAGTTDQDLGRNASSRSTQTTKMLQQRLASMFADNGTKLMPLLGVSGGEGKQDKELLDVMASQFAMEQGDVVTTEAAARSGLHIKGYDVDKDEVNRGWDFMAFESAWGDELRHGHLWVDSDDEDFDEYFTKERFTYFSAKRKLDEDELDEELDDDDDGTSITSGSSRVSGHSFGDSEEEE